MIAATTFGLTSCSDSNGGDSPSGGDGEGQTAYLAVRLSNVGSVPGMGSKAFLRAATDNDVTSVADPNEPGTGKYVDGDASTEGAVNTIRFYFFNSDGTAYTIENGKNYKDVAGSRNAGDRDDAKTTIESKTDVVLVINGDKNNSQPLPSRMAVVLNKGVIANDKASDNTTAILPDENLTETELAAITRTIHTNHDATNGFVMTNSVYYDESSKSPLISTPIDATKFKRKAIEAQGGTDGEGTYDADPVEVYVERVAAGVQVAHTTAEGNYWTTTSAIAPDEATIANSPAYRLQSSDATFTYKEAKTDDTYSSGTTPQLFVVVQGWGLADENDNAPLVKDLEAESSYNGIGTNATEGPISVAAYHRSFWETANGYAPIRKSYNDYISTEANKSNNKSQDLGTGRLYTMPNTPSIDNESGNNVVWGNWKWSSDDLNRRTEVTNNALQSPTKVVVAAKLMYVKETTTGEPGAQTTTKTLEPAEICKYRGQNYLTEGNLKIAIANDVAHSTANNVYKKTSADDVTPATYEAVTADDFADFIVSGNAGTKESYRVTPQLKTLAANKKYYQKTGDAIAEISYAKANENVAAVAGSDITIYRQGMTYYYTTLHHLWYDTSKGTTGEQPQGAWGVVRNHLYNVTLTTISGLGTPVYDPAKVIIPIVPKDENVYLGARVNVLQWRLVNQDAAINGSTEITPTPANP